MFGQAKRLLLAVSSGICAYAGCSAQRGTGPHCQRQEEAAVPPPRPRGSISSVDLRPGLSSEWASRMCVVALTPSCLLDGLWAHVVSVVLTSASGSISRCSRIDPVPSWVHLCSLQRSLPGRDRVVLVRLQLCPGCSHDRPPSWTPHGSPESRQRGD